MHEHVQKTAAESQKCHEEIIKSSKEIDGLRMSEKEAFKNFVQFKKNFNEANSSLKEKLNQINLIREKIDEMNLEEEEKIKLRQNAAIMNKEQEIEEKFKTGKKLTTDDFIVFQDIIKNKKKY